MWSECFAAVTLLCRSVYLRSSVVQLDIVCLGHLCIFCTPGATKFRKISFQLATCVTPKLLQHTYQSASCWHCDIPAQLQLRLLGGNWPDARSKKKTYQFHALVDREEDAQIRLQGCLSSTVPYNAAQTLSALQLERCLALVKCRRESNVR